MHFDAVNFYNIGNANIMRACEVSISMDENDCLFKFLGTQLKLFLKTCCLELIVKLKIILWKVAASQCLERARKALKVINPKKKAQLIL